jgi:transposase
VNLFWLSDEPWAVLEPFMPINQPGARRVDDRRVISGIVHVLKTGGRWRDCPQAYGPHTTVYNRYNRWSRRGFWRAMLAALAKAGWIAGTAALDSTYVKAHRSAHGGKGGARSQAIGPSRGGQTTKVHVLADVLGRPAVIHLTPGTASDGKTAPEVLAAAPGRVKRLIADRGYDANHLRRDLKATGTTPVIPGTRSRKRPIRHDERRYRERWRIEAAFCRLKDFRRVATRYDKLAANYASAVALAAVIAFWC